MPTGIGPRERRNQPRLLCADLVDLKWEDEGRSLHEIVNLEDISASGMGLTSSSALKPGTQVRIQAGNAEFRGCVRHCQWTALGFQHGIELHPTTRWCLAKFRPLHLFDPAVLGMEAATFDGAAVA